MAETKRDVRLQVFVTDAMDNKISDLAELMGMRKNEVVRVAIASYLASWEQSKDLLREYANKELKRSKTSLEGQMELGEVLKQLETM